MSRMHCVDKSKITRPKSHTDQRGMSLVELMIGLVVGLILLGGVIQTLLVSKEASKGRQSMATITENARFVFEFMGRDLRMAGRNTSGSLPIEYTGGALIAHYSIPVSSSVEQGITVTYKHDVANKTILYSRSVDSVAGSEQVLIDGVDGLNFAFGRLMVEPDLAASEPGKIQYFDQSTVSGWGNSEWGNVISLRAEIVLDDPASQANDIELKQKAINQTITLRNRVLEKYQP